MCACGVLSPISFVVNGAYYLFRFPTGYCEFLILYLFVFAGMWFHLRILCKLIQ